MATINQLWTNLKTLLNRFYIKKKKDHTQSANAIVTTDANGDAVTSATISTSKITGLSAVATSGSYNSLDHLPDIPSKTSDLINDGDGANTFVMTNDTRLTNARTPTSHKHGNIENGGTLSTASNFVVTDSSKKITTQSQIGQIKFNGAIGTTANKPLITTSNGVVTTGSFGTGSNTFAMGNHTHDSTYLKLSNIAYDNGALTVGAVTQEELYKTDVHSSRYNFKIDQTSNVRVRMTDYNNQPVIGKTVTVTANIGQFENGELEYTGTTDENGEFTVTYTATQWGIINFRANEASFTCIVNGFRKTTLFTKSHGSKFDFFVNELTHQCILQIHFFTADYSSKFPLTKDKTKNISSFTLDKKYTPPSHTNGAMYRPDMVWGLYTGWDPQNNTGDGIPDDKWYLCVRSMIANATPGTNTSFQIKFEWTYS